MASAPGSTSIVGRVDRHGHLVSGDAPLLRLQESAGSGLGRPIAVPQLASLVRSAASLMVPLSRAVLAADDRHDIDLWVRAEPDDDGVTLRIERWSERPPAPPRLVLVGNDGEPEEPEGSQLPEPEPLVWATDAELRFTRISPALAEILQSTEDDAIGQPLTRLFRLVEDDDGRMPLLVALAAREDMGAQQAHPRHDPSREIVLTAQPQVDPDGRFAGFSGRATLGPDDQPGATPANEALLIDHTIDEALRSPLDRIIDAADRIVERSDGPLRSDYASYAGDIAAAGRHLLSVIRSMSEEASVSTSSVDLVALVDETEGLVETASETRQVRIEVEKPEGRMVAKADARGVVQILVNVVGNAIRHSPVGSEVQISFAAQADKVSVTVADRGPGIAAEDQGRIFERYEQAGSAPGSTGLGLTISRRLARSMGGDLRVESAPDEGARFTLDLPAA